MKDKPIKLLVLLERENEIWEKAVLRLLDKTDWDIYEWLEDEEADEYRQIMSEISKIK